MPLPLILLASAEQWLARSVASVLEHGGYGVARASTALEALDAARLRRPDAIILDLSLDQPHGFDACRALRSDPAVSAATPIVLITLGPVTRSQQLDALRAGAWELRGQPLDAEELLLRLGAYIKGKLEIDRLGTEGLVDPASGLYNASGMERRAEELASLTARQGLPLACVVFRSANGNGSDGDRLARAFKTYGRVSDAIGRTGPEEFAVFAPATDGPAAARLARRLTGKVGGVRSGYSAAPAGPSPSTVPGTPHVSPQMLLAQARAALGA